MTLTPEIPAVELLPNLCASGEALPEHIVVIMRAFHAYKGDSDTVAATVYRHARVAVHYVLSPWGTYTVLASKGRA